ncbi:MAG: pilus assembly protein TadG-related protein [Candidatus Methylacidiphilales bacterium]|nr:pilus assembly protein TadG-related protein [Candidatus Methylacidiphilales bacterium]
MNTPWKNRHPKRGGSTLLLSVFFILTLLMGGALTVDISLLALEAHSTQSACDAAALAGAVKLVVQKTGTTYANTAASELAARNEAIFISSQNGVTLDSSGITFPLPGRIRVQARVNSGLFLARVIGLTSTSISRSAAAEISSLRGLNRVGPLGLSLSDYQTYAMGQNLFTVTLARNTSDAFSSGHALALSFDGNASKPVSVFENELRNGYAEKILVGQTVNSLNGATAQQNALRDAMNARLSAKQYFLPVVIIPDKDPTVGTSTHVIQTIAMVRVRSVTTVTTMTTPSPGNNGNGKGQGAAGGGTSEDRTQLTLQFVPDYLISSDTFKITLGANGDTPLRTIRLVDESR